MIKFDSKPHKTVESFRGVIELDQEYGFIVEKTTKVPPNDDLPYYVESVWITKDPDEEINQDRLSLIEESIKNYCLKNGIGE